MGRIYKWVLIALISGSVLLAGVLFTSATANKNNLSFSPVEVLPQVEGVYERTREQANLPVLLPTEFPGLGSGFWLSEYVGNEGGLYTLSVDVKAGCEGAGACSRGLIGGEVVTTGTQPVAEIYAYLNEPPIDPNRPRSDDPMGPVELLNGIEGFFVPWEATAQCSTARVYWEQPSASGDERYRYYVGIECGDRADVVELANNIIANTEGF